MIALPALGLAPAVVAEEAVHPGRSEVKDSVTTAGLSITLILFLLYGPSEWYIKAPLVGLSIVGLVWRSLLTSPWLWLGLTSLLGAGVYVERFTADNHKYLMVYWALSVAISHFLKDPLPRLQANARLLIGLAFLFATGWKLYSPDFLNGSFLEFTMLSDQRFAGFAAHVSSTPADVLIANRSLLRGLSGNVAGPAVVLQGARSLHTLAQVMAWVTVTIEAWVATSFLVPTSWRLSRTRDVALAAFTLTVYAIATVPGFATLLIAMGIIQCDRKSKAKVWLYFVALFATQLYTMPWDRIAQRLGWGTF